MNQRTFCWRLAAVFAAILVAGLAHADSPWTGYDENEVISFDDGNDILAFTLAKSNNRRTYAVWLEDADDSPVIESVRPHLGEFVNSAFVEPFWTSKLSDFSLDVGGPSKFDLDRLACDALVYSDPHQEKGWLYLFVLWVRKIELSGTFQLCYTKARFPANEFEPYQIETKVLVDGSDYLASPNVVMDDVPIEDTHLFLSWIERDQTAGNAVPVYLEFDPFDPAVNPGNLVPSALGDLDPVYTCTALSAELVDGDVGSMAAIGTTQSNCQLLELSNPASSNWLEATSSSVGTISSVCVAIWKTPGEIMAPCVHYITLVGDDESNSSQAFNYFIKKLDDDTWTDPTLINPSSPPESMNGAGLLVSSDPSVPWLASWSNRVGSSPISIVKISNSTDQGVTWTQDLEDANNPDEGTSAQDTYLFETPGGVPAVVWREEFCPENHFEALVSYRLEAR